MTNHPPVDPRPILLVEDEREFAIEIKNELEGGGYIVRLASMADHDDAAYGVMGLTGVAGLLLESNCRA